MFVTLQLCIFLPLLNFVSFSSPLLSFAFSSLKVPLWIFFQNVSHCPSVRLLQSPSADSLSVRAAWWEESRESRRSLISPHFTTNSNAPNLPGTRLSECLRTLLNVHCPNPLNWWKWKLMTALIMGRVKVRQTVRFLLLQLMKVDWFKPTLMVIEQNTLLGTNYQVYWNAEAVGRSNSEEIIKEVNSLSRGEIL